MRLTNIPHEPAVFHLAILGEHLPQFICSEEDSGDADVCLVPSFLWRIVSCPDVFWRREHKSTKTTWAKDDAVLCPDYFLLAWGVKMWSQ